MKSGSSSLSRRGLRTLRGILICACAGLLCLELNNVSIVNSSLEDNLLNTTALTNAAIEHASSNKTEPQFIETPIKTVFGNTNLSTGAALLPVNKMAPRHKSEEDTVAAQSGFAIAYVIGGCKPENPVYRNYFYDIAVSVNLMREENSIADLIVFVQMSYQSKFDELPTQDTTLLEKLGARIIYIPKAENESFYRTMLDKFRILSLTEYNRVLFMDGDVMALGSMDYLYHLSMDGTLKDNIVMAGKTEPANGGFFMLSPKTGSLERIMDIIRQKEIRGAAIEYPHFDRSIGWGHVFNDDYYQFIGAGRKMKEWKFHGDFADQGLLYQWVKYEEKSVSIVFSSHVENYGPDPSSPNEAKLEHVLQLSDILDGNPAIDIPQRTCWKKLIRPRPCRAPHTDFIHFTGTKKPWLSGPPTNFTTMPLDTPQHYWFKILHDLKDSLQLDIDFEHWNKKQRPLLGLYPTHGTAAKTNFSFRTRKR